jgi:hypothetical protein
MTRRARWKAHEGHVRCLALSGDEATLATGGDDGAAKLWTFPGGELIKAIPPAPIASNPAENPILAAAFSAGGEVAYFVNEAGEALAYRVAAGELAWRAPVEKLGGKVGIAAASARGGIVALGRHTTSVRRSLTREATETILLFSFADRRVIGELSWSGRVGFADNRTTHSVGLTADGSALALAGIEAAFDTDEDWLGFRCYAALFQTDPVDEKGILFHYGDYAPPWGVRQVIAIHPQGTHLGLVTTCETRGAEHTYTLGDREVIAASQLRPKGHYQHGSDDGLDDPFRHLGSLETEPTALAFSPDGSLLALADAGGASVADWTQGTSGYLDDLGCDAGVTSVLFSPSGGALIYGRADGVIEIVKIP